MFPVLYLGVRCLHDWQRRDCHSVRQCVQYLHQSVAGPTGFVTAFWETIWRQQVDTVTALISNLFKMFQGVYPPNYWHVQIILSAVVQDNCRGVANQPDVSVLF